MAGVRGTGFRRPPTIGAGKQPKIGKKTTEMFAPMENKTKSSANKVSIPKVTVLKPTTIKEE